MSQIIDTDLENRIREVEDGSPDYGKMRKQIVMEVEKRRSGWRETHLPVQNRWSRKAIYTASGALACAVVAGVIFSQQSFTTENTNLPNAAASNTSQAAYSSPAGQSLDTSSVVQGVKLTLENAIQGHFAGVETAAGAQKDRLALQMSLNGLSVPGAEYAGFASTTLTDLESGKSQTLRGPGFDLRQGLPSVYDSQVFDGDWTQADEKRRYRFETSDLYTVKRQDVPLQGTIQAQKEYPISSLAGASVKLLNAQWDEGQGLLTLDYELQGIDAQAAAAYPESLSAETQNLLLLHDGTKTIEPTSGTVEGNHFSRSYELYGMDESQRQSLTMSYSYAETVKKIAGTWKVDFTLDGSQAQEKSVKVTAQNAEEIQQKTGWKLGQAAVGAYGVYLPIERAPEDRKLHAGVVLDYEKATLLAPGFESTRAEHSGNPLQEVEEGQTVPQQESLSFRLMSEELRDFSPGPLSIQLQNARVVQQAPADFQTLLASPSAQEQTVDAVLPDGGVLHYRYSLEGSDLKVITETEGSLHMEEAPILHVDGHTLTADQDSSSELYRPQGGYRVDVYKNIPQGAEPEITPGLYSRIDSSRDTEIVLRK
ncbi:hypothetical protein B9G55_18615 [Saccharibacillus sp. O16]|nr:hypothetical protein B9G55_18615 [Saccharibacillus sp. O16]